MSKRLSYVLLSVVALSLVFGSCKKPQYSTDEVLPPSYSPSIIVGSNNQVLYALHPSTGEKNWELGLSSKIIASPIVYKGNVYVASSVGDTIFKINSKTGELIDKITYSGGGAGAKATPIADEDLLFVASMNGGFYVINLSDGTTKWSVFGDGPIEASPTIHNGFVYFATSVGTVYCYEKLDGTTATLPAPPSLTWSLNIPGASFVSSPAVGEPYLYVGSITDSNMYCMYLESPTASTTGGLRWSYKTKGGIRSSPAAYKGTCIFGSNDFRVYCLDTAIDPDNGIYTPEARWVDSMHSEVTSSPFPYEQVVYVGCKDYRLYALDILAGRVKWSFSSNGIITSSPLAYGGSVYVGSYDKYFYALDTARGTLRWKSNINGQIDCSPVLDNLSKTTGYNSQISGYTN